MYSEEQRSTQKKYGQSDAKFTAFSIAILGYETRVKARKYSFQSLGIHNSCKHDREVSKLQNIISIFGSRRSLEVGTHGSNLKIGSNLWRLPVPRVGNPRLQDFKALVPMFRDQ